MYKVEVHDTSSTVNEMITPQIKENTHIRLQHRMMPIFCSIRVTKLMLTGKMSLLSTIDTIVLKDRRENKS